MKLEIRLILKNIRKQAMSYIVYFVGMITIISLIIMYTNFVNAAIVSFGDAIEKSGLIFYKVGSYTVIVLILLFLLFITVYSNKMMRKLKAREYGLYKLYGITNKNLFKIIFFEQFLIMLISFIIAVVIGTILNFMLIFIANLSLVEFIDEGLKMVLNIKGDIFVFLGLVVVSYITSIFNYRAVKKMQIVDLLNEDKNLKPAPNISFFEFIFYIVNVIIFYSLIMYILQNQLNLMNIDELILIIVSWCLAIYFSYKVVAYLFIKFIPRKILYRNENVFTIAQITRKLSKTVKAMTFVTIFLVFLCTLIFVGILTEQSIKMTNQKNDVKLSYLPAIIDFIYENQEYNFKFYSIPLLAKSESLEGDEEYNAILESDLNLTLEKNNLDTINLKKGETIVINPVNKTDKKYYVHTYSDQTPAELNAKKVLNIESKGHFIVIPDESDPVGYGKYINRTNELLENYKDDIKTLSITTSDNFCVQTGGGNGICPQNISESDMNKYFEYYGIDQSVDINQGEFVLYGNSQVMGVDVSEKSKVEKEGDLTVKDDIYLPELGTALVMSDEDSQQRVNLYEKVIIDYIDLEEEQDEKWAALDRNAKDVGISGISVRTEQIKRNSLSNVISLSFTVYIAFIILILLICILSLHTSIDSLENKKEFAKLKRINYLDKDLKRSVNKITGVYFVVPLCLAMFNLYIYSQPLLAAMKGYNWQYIDFSIGIWIGVMLMIIYVGFMFLANYYYKKVVI